jgi:NitT/TauT family transport system substrate-binding protein
MTRRSRCAGALLALAAVALSAGAAGARAETAELRIGVQFGVGYLPVYVAQADDLINQRLAAKGLPPVAVTIQNVTGATQISDGLLSRTMEIGCGGITAMMVAWDKTKAAGGQAMKGMVALSSMPYELFTVDPKVMTLADLSDRNKIGVTAIKVSIPAIFLQMAAARLYGADNYQKLDALTVSFAQPDGVIALLSGGGAVDSYVFAPPFSDQVRTQPKIHRVWSSAELAGALTSLSMWTTTRFRQENPATYAAVIDAMRDAMATIRRDPRHAAEIFIKAENSKLPIDFVTTVLGQPDLIFGIAPQHSLLLAQFLAQTGLIKSKPADWQDYFFPDISGEPGG